MENQNPIQPVSQDIKAPQSVTSVSSPINPPIDKPKSKLPILIIGIILFLLIAGSAAGFYVFNQQSFKTAVKPTPSPVVQKQIPSPTPDPTASWKTYTDSDLGYSIMYPPNNKRLIIPECPNWNHGFMLVSDYRCGSDALKEMFIDSSKKITPEDYSSPTYDPRQCYRKTVENILFAGKSTQKITYNHDTDKCGKETGQLDQNITYMLPNETDIIISYTTDRIDESIFNTILSTFKFTDQQLPPGGQYSSEGQSCGTNAGPAGNAQCAPGLTCVYKTPQEQTGGIGTCVKE